ncbi:T9SS type B sorting domain-containing protein [Catalinimonas niigatensis]|uniref:T9SS type B sorting domain-containing protein n=1 Tax=Catalinimonas niigatensis TaxID=1397264 RepID=UPI00266555A0|nr:gliding motility-associated C-terminal domain-containing protein [Catalinimonas niigatensis]WPP49450.1 gliding motility-associated C-terminal domain-containing protein [Catalinimonas niigatensis]
MTKARILLSCMLGFSLCMLSLTAHAQWPTNANTVKAKTDEQCFNANDGILEFTFNDGVPPSAFNYRVQLYNFNTASYVYDDNNLVFLNVVPAPIISGNTLVFNNVIPGDLVLVLSNDDVSINVAYGVGYTGAPYSGMRIIAANEIIIDEPTLVTTGNDQCAAPYNGSIDATGAVSGGAVGGYEYSIDGGATYQPAAIFNNLMHGSYTLRVRDTNGCIKEEANIVVDDNRIAPTAGITPSPASVCIGEDLILNGNPTGGMGGFTHSWTGDTGPLSATNVVNPTFNVGTAGSYTLIYTVTDANGCTATSNISVTVNALPTAIDQTPEVCADIPGGTQATGVDLTALNALVDGGNGLTVRWYTDAGPSNLIATPASVTVNDGDDFFAEIEDGNGCTDVAMVTYSVVSAPLAPANLQTNNIVCDGFELSWDASATATSYRIEIDDDPAFGSIDAGGTQGGTTFVASGLSTGVNYNIRIVPINSCGDGTAATRTQSTTDVPAALANLASANPVCDGFDLSWDASLGAADYRVERDDDPTFASIDETILTGGATNHNFIGLALGTQYFYRVTPINSCGDGTADDGDETTTDVPAALANLASANPVCDGFDLSWDASATATSYRIEIDEDNLFGSPEVNLTQAGVTYTATGLALGTQYFYRVTPINSCGDGTADDGDETTTDVPAALANLASANPVCDGFDLSWDASATATSYRIEIDEDNLFGSPEVNLTQAGATYTATGLALGTQYFYRVTPINSCGDGTADDGDETTTDVPAALANLVSANPVCDGFDLSWDASLGAADYRVERDDDPTFASIDETILTGGATNHNFIGLALGTQYFYRVTPINSCGDGTADDGDETTTDVPAALANLVSANPVCDGFDLSWDVSLGAEDYLIEIDDDALFGTPEVNLTQAGVTYTAAGLSQGSLYHYRVTPRNTCGDGTAASGSISTIDVTPAPVNPVSSAETCDGFTASWNAVAGADSYLVEVSTDGFGTLTTSATPTANTVNISGLSINTIYEWRVTAINACGSSIPSASQTATTTDVPEQPTGLLSSAEVCDGFRADWTAALGAASYLVEVSNDNFVSTVATANPTAGTETATFTGLTQGTTYKWRVTAINSCGNSIASVEQNATTTTIPVALANLQISNVVCDGFDLSWDASVGATNYRVEISEDAGFVTHTVNTTQAGETYTASTLSIGTEYFYRITPINICGDGIADGSNVTTTDVPEQPTGLLSSAEVCDGFRADWTAALGAASYLVEVSNDNFVSTVATANPTAGTETATFTGLTQGTTYKWRVTAINSCGNSILSAEQSATTLTSPTVTDPAPQICSDAIGGNTASNVNLTIQEGAIDGNAGNTFVWYSNAAATVLVPDATNVSVTDGQRFYARVGTASCEVIASLTYTLNSLEDTSFDYVGSPYCQNDPANPIAQNVLTSGGTFSSTPGLVFANPATGEINLAASADGNYTITYTTGGTCPSSSTFDVVINPANDPTFSYANNTICQDAGTQPATTTQAGGTFSAMPAGLSIDAITGEIDPDPLASTPGTYTVTYAFGGSCPSSTTVNITITNAPDATFSYAVGPYCQSDTDPTPAFDPGTSAGTFSAPAGLIINATTGVIDLSASTPGNYTVTNTIAPSGTCAGSIETFFPVEILPTDDASFDYGQSAYCKDETNPSAQNVVTSGGNFSSTVGLVFANAGTGEIDLAASTAGTYTITYATLGACPASSTFDVTINTVDDPSFEYNPVGYCKDDINPTANVLGTPGGTFTSLTADIDNPFTGEINLANTDVGTHTITYTTTGTCSRSSTFDVEIFAVPTANNLSLEVCEDAEGSNSATVDLTALESAINGGAGLSFTWYDDAGLAPADEILTPNNYSVSNGTYYAVVSNGNCQSVATVTYTVRSWPALADLTPEVCETTAGSGIATVSLSALEASMGAMGLSFNWYTDAAMTIPVSPGSVSVSHGDDFFARATDGTCSNTASVTFTVNTLPTVSFSGFTSPYCETDGLVVLTGTPLNGIFTGPGIADNGDGTANFDPSAAGEGTHMITYSFTDVNGCTAQSSQTVVVNDCTLPLNANFIADVTNVCVGQTVTFTDQSFGHNPALNAWDFLGAATAVEIDPGTYQVTYGAPGTYDVSLIVSDGVDFNTKNEFPYITVNPADDSGFNYASTDYCPGDPNPTPILSDVLNSGTFTASPAGLVIDANDGTIDIAASIAGPYTIRYTTQGACPTFTEISININPAEDPSFTYANSTYCQSDPVNPTAMITGGAGAFDAVAGIVWADATTGIIDLAASTVGPHTVTYRTSGPCPATATFDITIEAAPDATFSYALGSFCQTAGTQTPNLGFQTGGQFTSSDPVNFPVDLNTGEIDPAVGNVGDTYTISYQIIGASCSDTKTFDVTITGAPDAYFYYDDGTPDGTSSFCKNETNPILVFGPGATPGVFSSAPVGLALAADGSIDLAASTAGITYTVTNTISSVGACAAVTHSVLVEIRAQEDAGFAYAEPSYCINETTNPLPTVTGTTNGIFASSDPGLVVNASTGTIDLAASSVGGPYTITYTTQGSCFDSQSVQVTLTDAEDASFNYGIVTEFCKTGTSPAATITGVGGGEFSTNDPDLIIDISSGVIDFDASTVVEGDYVITYTTPGTTPALCEANSTITITIFAQPSTAVAGPIPVDTSCEYVYTLDAEAPAVGTGMWTVVTPTGTEIVNFSDANDPKATVTVSDFGPYQFRWTVSNGSCSSSDVIQVEFYEPIDFGFFGRTNANCTATPGGRWIINPAVVGGSGSFSFAWKNSEGIAFDNDRSLNNIDDAGGIGTNPGVPGGIYIATVTDDVTGCESSKAIYVTNSVIDTDVSIVGTSSSCNVSGTGNGQIDISYLTGTGPYRVAVHNEDGSEAKAPANFPAGTLTDQITGLSGGIYYVEVQDQGSGCSHGERITIAEADPLEIDNVMVSAASCFGVADGSITMDVSGGTGTYTFSWKDDATDLEVSDQKDPSGLAAGTYYVEVTDALVAGCVYTSEDFIIIEPAPETAPVLNAATAIGCNAFTINWSNESVLEYDVQISELADFSSAVVTYNITDGSTSFIVNTGLSASTTYHYRVRAHKSCDWTAFSTAASVSTTAPPVPVAIAASSVFCDAFTANWNNVSGALGYEIDVATTNTFDPLTFVPGYEDRAVPGNSISVSGLTVGNTYHYRVKAETACGWSVVDSNVITVPLGGGPGTPNITTIDNASCNGFDVRWNLLPNASGYTVQVDNDADFSSIEASNAVGGSSNMVSFSSLVPNTAYHIRVIAQNACGTEISSAINFSTAALPLVFDQTRDVCSDVAGGNSASNVNLVDLQSAIDNNAGLAFAWFTDLAMTPADEILDPTSVDITGGGSIFYARVGSGNCTNIASVTYTVLPLENASFSYAGSPYCQYASNVTPTISGDAGTFSSTAGLVFADANTGEIDLTASGPGTYTITYTTSGSVTCFAVSTQDITIDAASDPSFSYASGTFCPDAGLQLPIVNETGGTFTAGSGLVIDAATGEIDPLTSTAGAYTVTYGFVGTCPSSATFDVTITGTPDATFTYAQTAYCLTDVDPTPTFASGASAGVFSAPAGLIIDPNSGVIDVDASAIGSYLVTNTIPGVGLCTEVSHDFTVEILAPDNASFSYSQAAYCQDEGNPVAIVSGTTGGIFSSASGLVFADASTGEINLAGSTPGTYLITYTTLGTCNAVSTQDITINAVPDPSFNYASATFCPDAGIQSPVFNAGGTFTSIPTGLMLDGTTGEIDPLASTAGTYTITYEIGGACIRSSDVNVTITGTPDATFTYAQTAYCLTDVDPTPTFASGASAGVFSAPAGLIIDPNSGVIDVDASAIGSYLVTNTIPGVGLCTEVSHDFTVEILAPDNASFSYSQAAYCQDEGNPVAIVSGTTGGIFSSASGLVFADASTGEINLAGSTPGTYLITYTTLGTCSSNSDVNVTINPLPNAVFSYATPSLCQGPSLVTPTIAPDAGGTFTAPAGLVIDPITGAIDAAASTIGGPYTITYTVSNAAGCTASATFDMSISDVLPAPTTLDISAPNCNGFTATWSAVAGAVQYRIEVSATDFTETPIESYMVDDTELSYAFTTLSSSVLNYEVRVVAIDACGNDGVVSAEVVAQTSPEADCGCGFEKARFVVSSENVNCPGSEDGALMISVNPTTTTTPTRFEYRYESEQASIDWTNGGGFPGLVFLADELPAGEYTVSIRDKNAEEGCEEIKTFTRTIRVQNGATLTTSPETCTGSDGKITISIPSSCLSEQIYEIIGRNADTGESITFEGTTAENLVAGSYEIILRNDLGEELEVMNTSVITTCSNGGGGEPTTACIIDGRIVNVQRTPVNCETGEGGVSLRVEGDFSNEYTFTLNSLSGIVDREISTVGTATFGNLPSGSYEYTVVDAGGLNSCRASFEIRENAVEIDPINPQDFILPACDASEQIATLNLSFSTLPSTTDMYIVQGADTISSSILEVGTNNTAIEGLPTGNSYEVVLQPRATEVDFCPAKRQFDVPNTGIVAISFDHTSTDIVCFGDGGTITVNNIVVAENTEFTINVMSVNQTQPYASRIFSAIPSSYTFANLEKGDYRVQIVQQQSSCGLISTESSPTFTIDGASKELSAAVPEVVHVTVNDPLGTIKVDSIQGGGLPYEVRIAADPNGSTTDWIEVSNSNPVINPYAYEFRDLEMGNYFIEVRDKFGCSLLYEVDIRYTEELYIPNIITPNGDGDNDTFRIINLELSGGDVGAKMVINNRWGKVVYRSDNYSNDKAWDGGEFADGLYFYELILPSGSKYAGWIEVWRGRTP